MCLFRLGEACDRRCPMCSNTGRPELRDVGGAELRRRLAFLLHVGFRRVMLTGGEPTLHPDFITLVDALAAYGVSWDVNTNGGRFADPRLATRARTAGLGRAIVSLHSHCAAVAQLMAGGISGYDHEAVLAAVANLRGAGVEVMLNAVLSRQNIHALPDYVASVDGRFPGVAVKLAFPDLAGRGGAWPGIAIRYDEAREPLRAALEEGRRRGVRVELEAVPCCVVGEPDRQAMGRLGFGETHYLDDATGTTVLSIASIEREIAVYGEACAGCAALARCPGTTRHYVARHGVSELSPLWLAGAT